MTTLIMSALMLPWIGVVEGIPTHVENEGEGPNCDVLRDCSMEYWDPWCGTNGRTYSSRCRIENAMCDPEEIKIKHRGPCRECFIYCGWFKNLKRNANLWCKTKTVGDMKQKLKYITLKLSFSYSIRHLRYTLELKFMQIPKFSYCQQDWNRLRQWSENFVNSVLICLKNESVGQSANCRDFLKISKIGFDFRENWGIFGENNQYLKKKPGVFADIPTRLSREKSRSVGGRYWQIFLLFILYVKNIIKVCKTFCRHF